MAKKPVSNRIAKPWLIVEFEPSNRHLNACDEYDSQKAAGNAARGFMEEAVSNGDSDHVFMVCYVVGAARAREAEYVDYDTASR